MLPRLSTLLFLYLLSIFSTTSFALALVTSPPPSSLLPQNSTTATSSLQLSPRQFITTPVMVVGSLLLVTILGWLGQAIYTVHSNHPGFNSHPGAKCFGSGSWTPIQPQLSALIPTACASLGSRALQWQTQNDITLQNPYVDISTDTNGSRLVNSEGYAERVRFGLIDSNGDGYKVWMGVASCTVAMKSLLMDCTGDKGTDTRGGTYFYGEQGKVGWWLDPNCEGGAVEGEEGVGGGICGKGT